ncbi:MAG: sigma-54-dependent Fis family transcriptional regulator [Nitrospirae bacterium]|nr:sigma-54-dependent Fis family transcriptional regulator [Nitrospirota bacterium]MBF0536117.1 sigma-54-dependent Fis family transcriptional regulator [Nitrospirota bacterium]MBF0616853.1 sigma-54-dependent Fis family transcriptional regulator [Nitrospirota bacterium]
MIKILIVDDEIGICRSLEVLLVKEGHEVVSCNTAACALTAAAEKDYNVAFVDLKLPDMDGLDLIKHIKALHASTQIIVITGFAAIETAVTAIKNGAYDYLTKPLSLDKVRITLRRALEKITMAAEINYLRAELNQSFGFENIIGNSKKITDVFQIIKQTAGSDSNVLITGESGTGKELVARAVHYKSHRKNERFVAVNCSAISSELTESEFFGYVKGAFTGAVKDKTGFLEHAGGGSLFLDEIGDTRPDFQVKLLRAIQQGEFNRVGSPRAERVNVRFIAATNRDLTKAMSEGTFREDLFYRLNVISIHLPPLRERREDIPLLSRHFLQKYSPKRKGATITGFTQDAVLALMSYDFPGNIRELENAIEYAISFASGSEITINDLPLKIQSNKPKRSALTIDKPLKTAVDNYEKLIITSALKQCSGNISQTARLLSIHRQSLQQKIKDFSINLNNLKDS